MNYFIDYYSQYYLLVQNQYYYLLFKKSKTIEVVVKDTIKPVLTLNDKEIEIYVVNTEYKEQGYTALDNVDGDITKKVKVDKSNLDIKTDISKIQFYMKVQVTSDDDNPAPRICFSPDDQSCKSRQQLVKKHILK